jgi:hypothetical protein
MRNTILQIKANSAHNSIKWIKSCQSLSTSVECRWSTLSRPLGEWEQSSTTRRVGFLIVWSTWSEVDTNTSNRCRINIAFAPCSAEEIKKGLGGTNLPHYVSKYPSLYWPSTTICFRITSITDGDSLSIDNRSHLYLKEMGSSSTIQDQLLTKPRKPTLISSYPNKWF